MTLVSASCLHTKIGCKTNLGRAILDESIASRPSLPRTSLVKQIVKLGYLAMLSKKLDESILVERFSEIAYKEAGIRRLRCHAGVIKYTRSSVVSVDQIGAEETACRR